MWLFINFNLVPCEVWASRPVIFLLCIYTKSENSNSQLYIARNGSKCLVTASETFVKLDWTRLHKLRSNFFRWVLPPDAKWMKHQTQIRHGWMFHLRGVGITRGSTIKGYALKTRGATMVVAVIDGNPLAGD